MRRLRLHPAAWQWRHRTGADCRHGGQTRALPAYAGQPIAFTEDDFAFDRPDNNFTAALSRRAGWGYFDPGPGVGGGLASGNYADGYQNVPVNWAINTPRKRAFFDLLRQVTGA